jgi:hypothetical protein
LQLLNTSRANDDVSRGCQRREDTEAIGEQLKQHFGARTAEGAGDECVIAATMVIVGQGGFMDPGMLVEVEVDALVL